MTLIIHLWIHKTATTFFQKSIFNNFNDYFYFDRKSFQKFKEYILYTDKPLVKFNSSELQVFNASNIFFTKIKSKKWMVQNNYINEK